MIIAAFFDIDGTVLAKNSGPLYLKFLVQEGRLGKMDLLRGLWWFAQYRVGRLNWEKMSQKTVSQLEGDSEEEMINDCQRWYEAMVRRHVRPEMVEAINKHKKQGQRVALLTSATIYLARPLGEDIGVDDYLCNRLVVKDGKFTGKMVEPACYGDGKVILAEKYAAENNISIQESYFYTDSITDLPVLLKVGNPIIVNPDPLLRREAKRRNWPVFDYEVPTSSVKSANLGGGK